ncbi:hypothetical protein PWT90_10163 [Aphanocladium album]|nr:hypothetical protein PWT90_10163 [Aphanocladium album]
MEKIDVPIAIIGLDARLPGDGIDAESFYQSLLAGRSACSEYPSDRYNVAAFWHPDGDRHGMTRALHAHFLRGSVKTFDAPFFSITPTEANAMDPQQRGLLESVYRAMDNAGIPLDKAAGTQTGVYMGCFGYDYHDITNKDLDIPSKYAALGPTAHMLANRVSWFYDFRGPSMTIDTACSSSLVAAHEACMSLKLGEISMAVVGGCNLILSPEMTINLDAAGVLGPDGKSYSFDHRGNGYARGEGFATILLKRVSDAVRDGDIIRAVIRNSSTNQDGRSQGITQPTSKAQAQLIRHVYDRANLDLSRTRFFEAHGTGTFVGDPIEASAIAEVFTPHRSAEEPIYVGALKTNIGHLEGAAGVASIIKGIMTLEHGTIPPNIHFEKRNPRIQTQILEFPTAPLPWPSQGLRRMSINSFGVGGTNVHIVLDDALHFLQEHGLQGHHRTQNNPVGSDPKAPHDKDIAYDIDSAKPANEIAKERSLNCLNPIPYPEETEARFSVPKQTRDGGDGFDCANNVDPLIDDNIIDHALLTNGQNGHSGIAPSTAITEVIRPYDDNDVVTAFEGFLHENQPNIFVFSSFDQAGIPRAQKSLVEYLSSSYASYDLERTSPSFMSDLAYTLAAKRTQHQWRSFCVASSQKELIEQLKIARNGIRAKTEQKHRLAFVFTGQGAQWVGMAAELMQYPVFHASINAADTYLRSLGCVWSIIAIQAAMIDLLTYWGVTPDAVIGHSAGETAAAYAAGAISRESAWRIAYVRGKLSSELLAANADESNATHGMGMAAVGLDVPATRVAIERVHLLSGPQHHGTLEISCKNSPTSQTVSGCGLKINRLVDLLTSEGTFVRELPVKLAYHSSYMLPVASKYLQTLGKLEPPSEDSESGDTSSAKVRPLFYSSSLGTVLQDQSQLRKGLYWVHNLTHPVLFSESAAALLGDTCTQDTTTILLEIGPHGALKGPLKDIANSNGLCGDFTYATMLHRNKSATQTVLEAMGILHCAGAGVNLGSVAMHTLANDRNQSPRLITSAPTYPFNHSKEYWMESRISQNYRFRSEARTELLGAQVVDWNKNHALWRNYIRVSENPWIPHHVVSGDVLYPAAGMLVMAIEAVRQLATAEGYSAEGFYLRNIAFEKALLVPDDAFGVESHFYLTPVEDSTREAESSGASCWYHFELFTYDIASDEWQRHCHGRVKAEYQSRHRHTLRRECEDYVAATKTRCIRKTSVDDIYEVLESSGLTFGPTFRRVSKAAVSPNCEIKDEAYTYAEIETSPKRVAQLMPHEYLSAHIIHPTTLDAMIHSSLIAPSLNEQSRPKTRMPVFLESLWLSARMSNANAPCHTASECSACDDGRKLKARIVALNGTDSEPVMCAFGLHLLTLPIVQEQLSQGISNTDDVEQTAYHVVWRPSVGLLDKHQCEKYFGLPQPPHDETAVITEQLKDNILLCKLYIQQYLDSIAVDGGTAATGHRDILPPTSATNGTARKYVAWMKNSMQLEESVCMTKEAQKQLEDRARATPEGRLILSIGQRLPSILSGDCDSLDVLFDEDLARDFYRQHPCALRCNKQLCNYVEALLDDTPTLKMLEIGAGTGGTTTHVLDMISKWSTNAKHHRFYQYDFTDISASFFERAKDDFVEHADRMRFLRLDIELDPVTQGFEAHTYDCIIAANVLHATRDIEKTLSNVRSLLKPGGKLILYEMTSPTMLTLGFVWGTLPGWWLSTEQDRALSPLMCPDTWCTRLRNAGFTDGVDIILRDFESSASQSNTILIATAPHEATLQQLELKASTSITILAADESMLQQEVASELSRALISDGNANVVISSTIASAHRTGLQYTTATAIVVFDLDRPILQQVSAQSFSRLQQLPKEFGTILWITRGGSASCASPEAELVSGFGRACRVEFPDLQFVVASFDEAATSKLMVERSIQIHKRLLQGYLDRTYRVSADGFVRVPRLQPAEGLTQHICAVTREPKPRLKRLEECLDEALMLKSSQSTGWADQQPLHFIPDDTARDNQLFVADEVEIRVMATGVSSSSIHLRKMNQIQTSFLGIEASGIVVRSGPHSKFCPGDHVFGLVPTGSARTLARSSDCFLANIPMGTSWREAATISVPYTTAIATVGDELETMEALEPSILITSAASLVGQAVIAVSQARGASIYATVSSNTEKEGIMKLFGLPRHSVLIGCQQLAELSILPRTYGRGVDIIASCSDYDDEKDEILNCLAVCGKIFHFGPAQNYISQTVSKPDVRLESFHLELQLKHIPQSICRKFQRAVHFINSHDLYSRKWVKRVSAYPFSHSHIGLRQLSTEKAEGDIATDAIVLECIKDDVISVMELPQTCQFEPGATYVICGGFGGLGETIARWMVSRGARNLILLSRSGPITLAAQKLIRDIDSRGCTVLSPICDATNLLALEQTIAECLASMPAIKGCVNAAMVLRDQLLTEMSSEQWNEALSSKTNVLTNLSRVLGANLDFFVTLSSMIGLLGNAGQANYASGNTFQDAFARILASQGCHAISLNLCSIEGVGFMAGRPELLAQMNADGWPSMSKAEFLATMDYHCRPSSASSEISVFSSHVVPRLSIPNTHTAKDALFSLLYAASSRKSATESSVKARSAAAKITSDHNAIVKTSTTLNDVYLAIKDALLWKICRMLDAEVSDVDCARPLHAYGIDSLMIVELRAWLVKMFAIKMSVFEMAGFGSIQLLICSISIKCRPELQD